MSNRAQVALVWWSLGFTALYAIAWLFFLHMIPPPAATHTAAEVGAFYRANGGAIRFGAMIASYSGGFMVPLAIVCSVQIARLEKGIPIWAITNLAGGALMTLWMCLPPIFWGVAAFSPDRPDEITKVIHEVGVLMLTTTDQSFIFQFVAMGVVPLVIKGDKYWPFPRWYGYATLWTTFFFEAGALSFLTKTGPFAWDGLFVFWIPLTLFFGWILGTAVLLFRSLKLQKADGIGVIAQA